MRMTLKSPWGKSCHLKVIGRKYRMKRVFSLSVSCWLCNFCWVYLLLVSELTVQDTSLLYSFCFISYYTGSLPYCIILVTYLDLVPLVPCGTLVDDSSPVGTIAGSSRLVAPVYARHLPIFFWCVLPCLLGSSNVLFAIFRSPFYGQASFVGGSRRKCSMKRLLLVATMSCNAVCPECVITSSFVMWSRHEIPSILQRQRRWNTSVILVAFAVVFHVSQA